MLTQLYEFLFLNDLPETDYIETYSKNRMINLALLIASRGLTLEGSGTYSYRNGEAMSGVRVGNIALYNGASRIDSLSLEKQLGRFHYFYLQQMSRKGFAAGNTREAEKNGYLGQDDDISATSYQFDYYYTLRGDEYSFVGPLTGVERQKRSSWSWLLGLRLGEKKLSGRNGLPPVSGGDEALIYHRFAHAGGGIAATWVLSNFYLAGRIVLYKGSKLGLPAKQIFKYDQSRELEIAGGWHHRSLFMGMLLGSDFMDASDIHIVESEVLAFLGTWL